MKAQETAEAISNEHCSVAVADGVLTLVMNRPEARNALSPQLICAMVDAWALVNSSPEIRVAVLTGAGGYFCSGADLKMLGRVRKGPPEYLARMDADPEMTQKALLHVYRLDKPLIAAVEGAAVGGGTEILQAADIRVAGAGARFGLPEVRWGLFPLAGSVVRLRRQIPYTLAAEMMLVGEQIDAERAERIGLVGRVVPEGTALEVAQVLAAKVVANGPLAVQAVMRVLDETESIPESQAIPIGLEIGWPIFRTEDAYEGTAAFAEKRRPDFKGA